MGYIHPAVSEICHPQSLDPICGKFDKFLAHGQAHMEQMGKCPWQCTTRGLDNSTKLRMEKIRQAVTEIWVPQVWQPPARPPGPWRQYPSNPEGWGVKIKCTHIFGIWVTLRKWAFCSYPPEKKIPRIGRQASQNCTVANSPTVSKRMKNKPFCADFKNISTVCIIHVRSITSLRKIRTHVSNTVNGMAAADGLLDGAMSQGIIRHDFDLLLPDYFGLTTRRV